VYLPTLELHEAATLDEAAALMARYGPSARLLAGGTDLLVDLKVSRTAADHLVSLRHVEGMRSIDVSGAGLRIGALTTLTRLNEASLPDAYAAIHDATSAMAAPHIRNVATVGGNLASGVPCADLPPVLIVMGASVDLFSPAGTRQVPVSAFFLGPRQTAVAAGEVLTRINVPAPAPRTGAAYARFSLRAGNAIAVASVAASLTLDGEGVIRRACLALGAVAPTPVTVPDAAAALVGRPLDEPACAEAAEAAMLAAEPISDVRASAQFRRELCGVLTGRALRSAAGRIERPAP